MLQFHILCSEFFFDLSLSLFVVLSNHLVQRLELNTCQKFQFSVSPLSRQVGRCGGSAGRERKNVCQSILYSKCHFNHLHGTLERLSLPLRDDQRWKIKVRQAVRCDQQTTMSSKQQFGDYTTTEGHHSAGLFPAMCVPSAWDILEKVVFLNFQLFRPLLWN